MGSDDSGLQKDDIGNPGWGNLRYDDLVIHPEDDEDDGLWVFIDWEPETLGERIRVKLSNEDLHDLYYQLKMFLQHWNRVKSGIGILPFFQNGKQAD